MESLNIKPTKTSLEVKLDPASGNFSFTGRARPENSAAFFNPIITWMKEYALQPAVKTVCTFRLEYFNSSARKSMADILSIFEAIKKDGKEIRIEWHYDSSDEGMKETGEEYKELFNLNFDFIPD